MATSQPEHDVPPATAALRRAGRTGWAVVGVAAAVAVVGLIASQLMVLLVPVVLALFPATLLTPVANALKRRRVPNALAALLTLLVAAAALGLVIGAMVPLVAAELPDLVESASSGMGEIEELLADDPLGIGMDGVGDVLTAAREQVGEVGDIAGQAMQAALIALETVIGLLLLLVVLFFYLKDGSRLGEGLVSIAPEHARPRVRRAGERSWSTLGSYFRGQLLVALVDAVAIGLGLVLLGVPLAVPLAVLIFFGGLFPIVGAVTTGALAVLVALADAGLVTALVVLGLILVVQQLESNVLEPFILGHVIRLHPLVVLLSITAGAVLIGILGAFLAVPIAAIVARVVDDVRAGSLDDPSAESAPA